MLPHLGRLALVSASNEESGPVVIELSDDDSDPEPADVPILEAIEISDDDSDPEPPDVPVDPPASQPAPAAETEGTRPRKQVKRFEADHEPTYKYKPRGSGGARGSGGQSSSAGRGRGRPRGRGGSSASPPVTWAKGTEVDMGMWGKGHHLGSSPLFRDGLFYGQTMVHPEVDGEVQQTEYLPELGLYTAVAIPARTFVAFYTGEFFTKSELDALIEDKPDRFALLQPYMVGIEGTNATIAAVPEEASGKIDPRTHTAATMNEPNKGVAANVFANTHTFELPDLEDGIVKPFKAVCLYTCTDVRANTELLYHYGHAELMKALREKLEYTPGIECPPTDIEDQTDVVFRRASEIAEDAELATKTLYDEEREEDSEEEEESQV